MTLWQRLWIYQAERFPLKKTVPLLAVFSAASLCASAVLAGRPLPGPGAFAAAFVVALLLFFQMRACDEWKDAEDDRLYRPERPIPRGLVSQRLILSLGAASLPVAALAAWAWHPPVLWLLGLCWLWLAAMTVEFGVPEWLKARPVLYLVSHMAIMPLIDLVLTGMEWLPGGGAAPGLVLFLALSFIWTFLCLASMCCPSIGSFCTFFALFNTLSFNWMFFQVVCSFLSLLFVIPFSSLQNIKYKLS